MYIGESHSDVPSSVYDKSQLPMALWWPGLHEDDDALDLKDTVTSLSKLPYPAAPADLVLATVGADYRGKNRRPIRGDEVFP